MQKFKYSLNAYFENVKIDKQFLVHEIVILIRPPDKSVLLKIIFLISQPKHMLWVLKRTVSLSQFF